MKVDYNPEGQWSADAVKKRYWALCLHLGGISGFEPTSKAYTNHKGYIWVTRGGGRKGSRKSSFYRG